MTELGLSVIVAAQSHPGRDPEKQVNEDAFGYAPIDGCFVAVVCDGMGGHTGGRLASNTAVQTLLQSLAVSGSQQPTRDRLASAVVQASAAVHRVGGGAPLEMRPGATCVALLLTASTVEVAHVGDSRCYRWRHGKLEVLTRDHSVIEAWIDAGHISREEAQQHPDAHRITRALGVAPTVEVEMRPTEALCKGDRYLLCTDGLTDLVSEQDVAAIMDKPLSLDRCAEELVALANHRGGHDNVTALLLDVTDPHAPAGSLPIYPLTAKASACSATERFVPPTEVERAKMAGGVDRTVVMAERPDATAPPPGPSPAGRTQPLIMVDARASSQPRSEASPLGAENASARSPQRLWKVLGLFLILVVAAIALGMLRRCT